MKGKYIIIVFCFFALNIFSQDDASMLGKNQTWQIDKETTPCNTRDDGECFLVKKSTGKDFEIFNETIEGFNFEQGNLYTIIVRQEFKQPPIAVGESVFKYVLVKIVSKKPVINKPAPLPVNTAANSQQKIFEVNFEGVPCEIDNSQICLLVKEKGKKEYEILNATIEGFNFQPGYAYVITVKPTTDGNFTLINEISKKLVKNISNTSKPSESIPEKPANKPTTGKVIAQTSIQTSSSLDGKWYLRKINKSEGDNFFVNDNTIWVQINTFNDRIEGNNACNKFSAVVKSDLNSSFTVTKISSGFTNCANKKIEDMFYKLLEDVDRFEVKNDNLLLYKQSNFMLGFTKNPESKEDISASGITTEVKKPSTTNTSSQTISSNDNDKYKPPVYSSSSTSTTTSSVTNTTSKSSDANTQQPAVTEPLSTEVKVEPQPTTTKINVADIMQVKKSASSDPCEPDISDIEPVIKRWDIAILGTDANSAAKNAHNVTVTGQIGKSSSGYFFNLIITKTEAASAMSMLTKYTAMQGNKFYFLANHERSIEFTASDILNDTVKDDVNNKITVSAKLLCPIKESDIKSMKGLLSKIPIDVINVQIGSNIEIDELVSGKDAKIIQDKLNCFFNSIQ